MAKKKTRDDEPNVKLIVMSAFAILLLLIFVAVWFFSGSSGGGLVTGKVTLNDEPVDGARLVFEMTGENASAPLPAQTNDQGVYTLFGFTDKSVPVGTYKVTVTKMTLKDGRIPDGEDLLKAEAKGLLKNSLPKAYEKSSTTPLTREIKSGKNVIDLELKK